MNQKFDSDDESDSPFDHVFGRDEIIVVIDCAASMFTEVTRDGENFCMFKKCLTVLERLLLNKIISSNKDLVSFKLINLEIFAFKT